MQRMLSCKKGTSSEEGISYPEEVIEKIVSLLPFPAILKARGLTKWWSAALAGGPAASLQYHAQVSSTDSESDKFCPVYVSPDFRCFIGFNLTTRKWRKMYNVAFFPNQKKIWSFGSCTATGALICGVVEAPTATQIFLKNVVSGAAKTLTMPVRPKRLEHLYVEVLGSGRGTFQILVYLHPWTIYHPEAHLQVYDSRRDTWHLLATDMPIPYFTYLKTPFSSFAGAAVLDDRLYVLYQDKMASLGGHFTAQLMAYTLVALGRDGAAAGADDEPRCTGVRLDFPLLHFPEFEIGGRPRETGLLVCDGELLVVAVSEAMSGNVLPAHSIAVFKLDLDSEDWIHVARGPPAPVAGISCTHFVAHKGLIYMGGGSVKGPVVFLVLDVRKEKWTCFSSPFYGGAFGQFFAFEPGLDPFVMI
ncbi:hypothetical protein MPTK1_2g04540 [Marchantia polymorpha subsp. ruderalis]|nr:hypothetical protein MARPO_0031s0109 [Marchantia polymorpha]BBN01092.1 hypothetical protein Mp_2g04540 [Marchantia polymorpha subsp. ruderalis]|eukprot:PTQ42141.1 hypothetical protein MARPO_0031s0109 [Marchantia polymorpha]